MLSEAESRSRDEHDPYLSVERIKRLMDAGQAGDHDRVIELCESKLDQLLPQEHSERFWLRYIEFFCAQGAETGLDQTRIVEDMTIAADRSELVTARVTARACRAILASTRGRYAQANPDLCTAVVLLSDAQALVSRSWPDQHPWRVACNTLALAFNRQGFHDRAAHWLGVLRQLIREHDSLFGTAIVTFNEAWIHLATALDRDLGEVHTPERARASYRMAARLFEEAELEAGQEAGPTPVAGPGRALAAVASILGGDEPTPDEVEDVGAEPGLLRPDHRALQSLALARVHTVQGDDAGADLLLDQALSSLPPDHSFRSIATRIQWEKVRIAAAATTADKHASAYRGMVQILIGDRRSEQRTRRAAYEELLQQERDRSVMLAERAAAELDPVTGLLARRHLEERLSVAMTRLGNGRMAYLIFVDLDNFKLVNDLRSHAAGDLSLQYLGDTLRRHLQEGDFAARYGGDEFVVVMFGRTAEQVTAELTRINQELVSITSTHPDIRTPVTLTAGAIPLEQSASPRELLHRADLAMIAGKRAGRNRITVHPPPG